MKPEAAKQSFSHLKVYMWTGSLRIAKSCFMINLLIDASPLCQATERVALLLVFVAAVLAFASLQHLILLVFLEAFTREMPYRKESSDRWPRRLREWWVRIPVAPVQLIKQDDKKWK